MTPEQRHARAARARAAMEEFVAPVIADVRDTYTARMVEVASKELARDVRSDKITALANALRILDQIESGMAAIINDGDIAARDILHARRMEDMTKPQRRLLGIAPGWGH